MTNMINNEGNVQISNDVIYTIAYTAMKEVEGACDYKNLAKGLMGKIFKNNFKGISIVVEENNVKIDINLIVKLDYNINEVAKNVQEKVKNAIETMTNLNVEEVNIKIMDIDTSKDDKENIEKNN